MPPSLNGNGAVQYERKVEMFGPGSFGMGLDPATMATMLAETMAESEHPLAVEEGWKLATDLIYIGAVALALSTSEEHKEHCDDHDHTPSGFLKFIAEEIFENDQATEIFEKVYEDFWNNIRTAKAERAIADLPEVITPEDILGKDGESDG